MQPQDDRSVTIDLQSRRTRRWHLQLQRRVPTHRASIVHNEATKTGGGVLSDRLCDKTLLPLSVRDKATISRNLPNDIVNVKLPGCS